MKTNVGPDPLDRHRFPADPWRLVERSFRADDLGLTETLFAVANGYLGIRGNFEEGRPTHAHGTFLNGVHETWPIRHAEAAFGFARTGQTIINAPSPTLMKVYVDDEPFRLANAEVEEYERSLDFRDGILRRSVVWRTPSGKRVRIETTRMVSMEHRHLAVLTLDVTLLDGDAPLVVSSQLVNRQDVVDEYQRSITKGVNTPLEDPRKAAAFTERVLQPHMHYAEEGRIALGYQAVNSGMTMAVAADHTADTADEVEVLLRSSDDVAKAIFRVAATQGTTFRLVKTVAFHSSRGVPVIELSDRCDRTLDRAAQSSVEALHASQRAWYDAFWAAADVELGGDDLDAPQQAIRFNLFSLAQASARSDGLGIAAKGLTGSGYEGHYFWDTEIYAIPFLTYAQPEVARNALRFRSGMLPLARERARDLNLRGALFPWRTINGEEASAYYAAGTAQMHIDADISYALVKYLVATGDRDFLAREGIDILVETARMWADLGFWRPNPETGREQFEIHGVTGPDEYTTVVNNNLFTNVMARANLENAVTELNHLRDRAPEQYQEAVDRLGIVEDEVVEWQHCADAMFIPFDDFLQIHPQDDLFLEREVWDLAATPPEKRPLLLHYHPLVIYRYQVLKQADVVLALFLVGDRVSLEQKRADFDYYDPITTGDSTLSAVVQSIIAAEVGYHDAALRYFYDSLYVDLGNLHDNTVDGAHIASCGGVWNALVYGFGGLRDSEHQLTFDPRLPASWPSLTYRLTWRGSRMKVTVEPNQVTFAIETCDPPVDIPIRVRGEEHHVKPDTPVVVPLAGHGARLVGHTA